MSRLYFHSPSGTAELHGSERAWLGFVADGPAKAAWGMDRHVDPDRLAEIIGMIPEVPDGQYGANYLHTYLREAQAEDAANKRAYEGWRPGMPLAGPTSYEASHRLLRSLETRLSGSATETVFEVAGHHVEAGNASLNTALAAGSAPIQLAAKIHGWCERHAWVDGPDRTWLAEIIDEGLDAGIYRRGFWYADQPDGPKDKWSSQGWEEVQAHLRSREDEPAVMSYSVCDSFPNASVSGWMDQVWPADMERRYDDLTEAQQQAVDDRSDAWSDLPDDEQWRLGMEGLRARRPWAQLTPENLGSTTFGPGVTVYDLIGPDREERVRRRFEPDAVPIAAVDHG